MEKCENSVLVATFQSFNKKKMKIQIGTACAVASASRADSTNAVLHLNGENFGVCT